MGQQVNREARKNDQGTGYGDLQSWSQDLNSKYKVKPEDTDLGLEAEYIGKSEAAEIQNREKAIWGWSILMVVFVWYRDLS